MSKVSEMMDSLSPARDENGSPVLQSDYDELKRKLADIESGRVGRSGDSTKNDHIFLQIADDGEREGEVTWCQDRIHDDDVMYIRADIVDAKAAEIESLKQQLAISEQARMEADELVLKQNAQLAATDDLSGCIICDAEPVAWMNTDTQGGALFFRNDVCHVATIPLYKAMKP